MAEKESDEYDPYKYRTPAKPNTNFETAIHILKGALGTGILALPQAFSNAGWIGGLIASFIVSLFVIYCLNLLIRCVYKYCKQEKTPNLTYAQAMKLAFSQGPKCLRCLTNSAPYITEFFLIFYQMGTCCVYIVFLGENIKQLFDQYVIVWDVRVWMAIFYVPLLALALIPDLKRLSPVSIFGNILIFVSLVCVMIYFFQDQPSLGDREKFVHVLRLPLYLGAILFALNPVAVIITVEANMKTPRSMTGIFGVLCLTLMATAIIYIVFGFLGFWKYGQECLGSVTLNLPKDEILANAVRILYILAILITYPLQAYVPVHIVWDEHLKEMTEDNKNQTLYYYLVRLNNVTITTLLAIAIPRLGLFISFIGVFCMSALGFVFPAMLHMCLYWPDQFGPLKWMLFKDILIVICGIGALGCGTYISIRDIILSFQ